METHRISSWQIMPHLELLWTGDVNIDASFALMVIVLWVIRMRH